MSQKTKILVFIDWFLPGYKAGGPIRSVANFIDRMHTVFDISVLTSDRDYLENEPYKNVKFNKWIDFQDHVKICYLSPEKLNKTDLKKIIYKAQFDVAYINGIYSYYFSILPLRLLKGSGKTIIIAPRGMLSKQAFSAKQYKKRLFLILAKISGLYKNVYFQATDKKEIQDIKTIISHKAKVDLIPNLPKTLNESDFKEIKKSQGELKLVSIARISPEKNILFALKVLLEYNYIGTIQFDLYGSIYNEKYWDECNNLIAKLPGNITVNYKSEIHSSKVSETFSTYHFAFMPSIGENFGHSVFESLSVGRPVIISDQTPWRNLEEEETGWDISLKKTEKFCQVLQYCIEMKQDHYNKLTKNAFLFAKRYTDNNELIESTKHFFER